MAELKSSTVFTVVMPGVILSSKQQKEATEKIRKVLNGEPVEGSRGWEVCVNLGIVSGCVNSD